MSFGFILISCLMYVSPAAWSAGTGAIPQPGRAALIDAPAHVRSLVRRASYAEINALGSYAGRVSAYVAALDGSVEPVRAVAREALRAYYAHAPLLPQAALPSVIDALDEGPACEDELNHGAFASKYGLVRYAATWRRASNALFPPGTSAEEFHRSDARPFSTSRLRNAFELAQAVGLRDEMNTALQLLAIFDRKQDLVRSVSSTANDEMLYQVGLHLLAQWYADADERFSPLDDTLRSSLQAFSRVMDPALRIQYEVLVGDLIADFFSPATQRRIDAHFEERADAKQFYLINHVGALLDAAASAGELRYIHTSEAFRGYPRTHVAGTVRHPGTIAAVERLLDYAATLGLDAKFAEVLGALAAIGHHEDLAARARAAEAKAEFGLALSTYAAAGDLDGVRRAFNGGKWVGSMEQSDHIMDAIDHLADDRAIDAFIAFLNLEHGDWARDFGRAHWRRTRIQRLPVPTDESLETLYARYLSAPHSPRQYREKTSEGLFEEAVRAAHKGSPGSAAVDAVRAAFLHADGR